MIHPQNNSSAHSYAKVSVHNNRSKLQIIILLLQYQHLLRGSARPTFANQKKVQIPEQAFNDESRVTLRKILKRDSDTTKTYKNQINFKNLLIKIELLWLQQTNWQLCLSRLNYSGYPSQRILNSLLLSCSCEAPQHRHHWYWLLSQLTVTSGGVWKTSSFTIE